MMNPIRAWWNTSMEPQEVEKASRRERLRREAWNVATIFISLGLLALSWVGFEAAGMPGWIGPTLIAFILLDLQLFGWGLERWDLTPPWMFREAEVESDE